MLIIGNFYMYKLDFRKTVVNFMVFPRIEHTYFHRLPSVVFSLPAYNMLKDPNPIPVWSACYYYISLSILRNFFPARLNIPPA